jgi:hypothetical protein
LGLLFIQVWRSSLNTNEGAHNRRKNTTESSYRKPNLCPSNPKRRIRTKSFPHTNKRPQEEEEEEVPREKMCKQLQREKDLIKKQKQ